MEILVCLSSTGGMDCGEAALPGNTLSRLFVSPGASPSLAEGMEELAMGQDKFGKEELA